MGFHQSASRFAKVLLAGLVIWVGCNPFAPTLEEGNPFADLFGDPTTISGFFTNFRTAYELRDITLYESLLDSAFVFTYRDFESQIDRQWGFAQDLEGTRRLFQGTSLIRLQWNQVLAQDVFDNQTQARIIRSFNLTVAVEGGEVFRGDGNVNFLLTRSDTTASWQLVSWFDESEF